MQNSILESIGNTPLIFLENLSQELGANIYAKCEFFNPGGSIKDRPALFMLEDAIQSGKLKRGIVEPTSGNTGIALALICAVKKIPLTIVMPENMSIERRATIKQLGAKLILTPASKGMAGAIAKAKELLASSDDIILNQFENPANKIAHYQTTAVEIFNELPELDIFLTAIGTGGTISGVGEFLKEQKSEIQIIGVEPSESAVLNGKEKGAHEIEGIGAGFIPPLLNLKVVDEVIEVSSSEAIAEAKKLNQEGFFVGISSGANISALKKLAKKHNIKTKTIVTIFQDSASRYLSTKLFQ